MKRQLLKGLRGYQTPTFSIELIAELVPNLIAEVLKMYTARNAMDQITPIGYDWNKMLEFQINLGTMIATKQFDYLDNVMIQFLKSYSYVLPPYRFFIKFPDEELIKYEEICNEFKGKEWNEIVDEFVDATIDLFESGKMFNKSLE